MEEIADTGGEFGHHHWWRVEIWEKGERGELQIVDCYFLWDRSPPAAHHRVKERSGTSCIYSLGPASSAMHDNLKPAVDHQIKIFERNDRGGHSISVTYELQARSFSEAAALVRAEHGTDCIFGISTEESRTRQR